MNMTNKYKKKLIEVALPLEAINAASAREKSIRHGHPSTLHLWWARRPLAACRAVLFAQLVDDPSEYADDLLSDPDIRKKAQVELEKRLTKREEAKAAGTATPIEEKPVTLEDVAVDLERKRLFAIIEALVKWENSTNEEVLEHARAEIRRSCNGELPPVYDPFSGGGSIPLEAQRLGLPAYGSDLNPVAVMIGKAMIEIPPKFKDQPPIHPGPKDRNHYRNAEGLAEDVRYYGEWMREKAWERIGHLYPQVDLPEEYGGGKATVIAWIWARTVPSPDPAFSDVQVPIASSFLLSSKVGKEAWIEPNVHRQTKTISYRIRHGGTKGEIAKAKEGTKAGRGANFRCIMSGTAIVPEYVKNVAQASGLGSQLIAIVCEGSAGKTYVSPDIEQSESASLANVSNRHSQAISDDRRAFTPPDYGMPTFGDLFTDRQTVALNSFADLLDEVREEIFLKAKAYHLNETGAPLREDGQKALAYSQAVLVYLTFCLDKCADYWSSLCSWHASRETIRNTFGRQALPIVWDYAEVNPFSSSTGNWLSMLDWIFRAVEAFVPNSNGQLRNADAQTVKYPRNVVISTDPPYYDNIGYADLSDFFYCWMRRTLKPIYPELFGILVSPKADELIASPVRHGGRSEAESFFLSGMKRAIENMAHWSSDFAPTTIYYAFKQSEIQDEGISSTGWATFLEAVVSAGYSVVGTWPMRTELANRMRGTGSNALANSVVLVCRKKESTADTITRAEFIRALKRELPPAIAELQAANIAPADMPQSAIGPGMGVFSRYKAVLESDDSPMSVKTALQLINRELDEYLGGIQGEFDADTRFAITWFEQNGLAKGDYGTANSIATARGISVDSVKHAGIVESAAGHVRILKRSELPDDWTPSADAHLTIWECCQHLIHTLENDGEYAAALLLKQIGPDKADAVKDLAYCLYDICSNKRKDAKEATSYNALIAVWTDLTREAAAIPDIEARGERQTAMNF